MRKAAALMIVALTACASPADVRRDGVRYETKLEMPPHQAARCIALKFGGSNPWSKGSYQVRPDGTAEVIGLEFERTVLVGELALRGQGSLLTVWISRSSEFSDPVARERFLSSC